MVAGRRIAVATVILARRKRGSAGAPVPRLREDRVAQRVLRDLEAAVAAHVGGGRALIVTLGAPLKVPGRLTVELAEHLRRHLAGRAAEADRRVDILGNRVRFRVLRDGSAWTSPVNGFVFSGDPHPRAIAEAMGALRERISAKAEDPTGPRATGDRWLVLAGGDRIADAGTYRRALSRLALPAAFTRILLVSPAGRVEAVAG